MKYKNKYNTKIWLIQMLNNLLKDNKNPDRRKKIKFEIGKLNTINKDT